MSTFLFHAKNAAGKLLKGEVEAASEAEAKVKLRAQRLIPIKVVPASGSSAKAKVRAGAGTKSKLGGKVKPKELQVFTRQFSVLIGAGVPVVQSLEAMTGPARTPMMNAALEAIIDEVGRGKPLAESMAGHPNVFDDMYTNLIKAGEEGGVLETILNRLAEYIEKTVQLKGRIKSALVYPAAIIIVSVLVIAAIMIFVIPSFVKLFQDSGQELPFLTVLVIDLSNIFVNYWYMIIIGVVGAPFLFLTYYRTEDGRKTIDPLLLKIPVFGDLILKGSIARFSRTLATMLTAGVRVVESLDISASVSGNYVVERILGEAKNVISMGRTMAEVFGASPEIPDMVAQMIAVGEQTGNLDVMLEKVADFYEDEVDATADAMTSLIEPMLMVVLGGVIAVLVVAMYLPIFNLASTMGA